MKITILAVGRIKEKFYRQAVAEFEKRLARYCRLQIIEAEDEKTPDCAKEALVNRIKEREGERLLKYIREDAFVCALAIDGTMMDSMELSDQIRQLGIRGKSHIMFVIGGSLGLADTVIKRADLKLSFSRMTFPHQLMRVILLEQVYRSFKIIHGEPYHK